MSSRVKFKIMYSDDHHDPRKRTQPYHPPEKHMVVMNGGGVFFLVGLEMFYPTVQRLSEVLPKYDVIWK